VSIFYKNWAGEGPFFPCHPEQSEGSAFSFFLISVPLHPYFNLQKGSTMSAKLSTSVSTTVDSHCQHISPKGNRCHMLIDQNRRPANGAARPTLCAYHADRLRASVPVVDPEVLAAELLDDINSFTTADEVNLFLGNLVRQLARKRIARCDAIALAYISQLILTSQTAMARERAAQEEAAEKEEHDRLIAGLRQASRHLASLGNQQSAGASAEPVKDDPQRAA